MLKHLNGHPELRSRVETMLLVVNDEMGNLQQADEAEMQPTEQMRRMGQVVASLGDPAGGPGIGKRNAKKQDLARG